MENRIILDAMKNEVKSDRESKLDDFFAGNKPSTDLEHTIAYAFLKQSYSVTQIEYSQLAGISDRTLRGHLQANKKAYEQELEKHKPQMMSDSDELSTTLSEEQLSQFVDNMVKSAIAPNATVRDREFLVNFTGLKAEDIMTLGQIKAKSLRWWIKGSLSKITKFMDTKQLGIMLNKSAYTYNGDIESKGNTQRFVNQSLEDELFKQELMYFGMVLLSLYNQKEHPDLEMLGTLVRVNKLEAGIKEPNAKHQKYSIQDFAKGKDIEENAVSTINDAQLDAMLKELGMVKEDLKDVVKAPPIPDKEIVEAKSSAYFEELLVLTSVEEEMQYMMNKTKLTKGSN
jgi:hypothetical protein